MPTTIAAQRTTHRRFHTMKARSISRPTAGKGRFRKTATTEARIPNTCPRRKSNASSQSERNNHSQARWNHRFREWRKARITSQNSVASPRMIDRHGRERGLRERQFIEIACALAAQQGLPVGNETQVGQRQRPEAVSDLLPERVRRRHAVGGTGCRGDVEKGVAQPPPPFRFSPYMRRWVPGSRSVFTMSNCAAQACSKTS